MATKGRVARLANSLIQGFLHGRKLAAQTLGIAAVTAGLLGAGSSIAGPLNLELSFPLIFFSNPGSTTFVPNASGGTLSVSAAPIAIQVASGGPPALITPEPVSGTESVNISIALDSAGNLIGGAPGDDLTIVGEVDLGPLGIFSGTLLTGEVVAFGAADSGGAVDAYDFEFQVTGGELFSLFGPDAGVTVTSELSTFTGDFTVAFGGQAKGNVGATPSECVITVAKTCEVVPPPASGSLLCQDKITATTLRYIGPDRQNVTVTFEGDRRGTATYANVDLVSGVTVLAGPNGFTVDARLDGGTDLGSKTRIFVGGILEEIIHTSCSAIYEAGQPAPLDGSTPNPANSSKGDPSPNWLVLDFVDKSGNLVEIPQPVQTPATAQCSVPSSADSLCTKRPSVISLRFNGGDCTQSANTQDASKVFCLGDAGSGPVRIVATNSKGDRTYLDVSNVAIGDIVEIAAANAGRSELDSQTDVEIFSGGTLVQDLSFHTSCSQPLALGDKFGSLEVTSFQNPEQGLVQAGAEVKYSYRITNGGSTAVEVTSAVDDKLGDLLNGLLPQLLAGEELTLLQSALIAQDTKNTVTVTARPIGSGGECVAADMAEVTVLPPPPEPFVCSEAKPINSLSMIWDGLDPVDVVAHRGKADDPVLGSVNNVAPGQEVTFSGFAGSGNDQEWEIFDAATGALLGLSRFHVSCSDAAMNGPEDCRTNQGDGKDNNASRINDWLLEAITGQNGRTLDCSALP